MKKQVAQRRNSVLCAAIASFCLTASSCERADTINYARSDGKVLVQKKVVSGGGAAGYTYVELYVSPKNARQRYLIARSISGDIDVRWRDSSALAVCFDGPPDFAVIGDVIGYNFSVKLVEDCSATPQVRR